MLALDHRLQLLAGSRQPFKDVETVRNVGEIIFLVEIGPCAAGVEDRDRREFGGRCPIVDPMDNLRAAVDNDLEVGFRRPGLAYSEMRVGMDRFALVASTTCAFEHARIA